MKKLNRAMVLTFNLLATAMLWWAFLVSSWVEIEVPGNPNVFVSALFIECSGETMCWIPKRKPTYFILGGVFMVISLLLALCLNFLLLTFPPLFPDTQKQVLFCAFICIITGSFVLFSLLMHYMQILEVAQEPTPAKVIFKLPYTVLLSSSVLFLLSGVLCFCNFQCFRAVGVLKSQPSHTAAISLEETKPSLKPSIKNELSEEDFPPIIQKNSATHISSKSSVTHFEKA